MMYPRHTSSLPHRGFTLLIALVLTSVVLAVGIALLDIAYKQILLASSAKNSQYAFYAADSALECALYYDQKFNAFGYSGPLPASSIECSERAVSGYTTSVSGGRRTTSFNHTCAGGGISAVVTIYKESSGSTNIYSNGFSTCDASAQVRVERGLKVRY